MDLVTALVVAFAVVGIAVIAWLIVSARASARRLDERIEQYHAEGPPTDPYSELAKLMAEDRASRPGSRRPRRKRGSGD